MQTGGRTSSGLKNGADFAKFRGAGKQPFA